MLPQEAALLPLAVLAPRLSAKMIMSSYVGIQVPIYLWHECLAQVRQGNCLIGH